MADKYVKTLTIETVVDKKQYKEFMEQFKKDSTAIKLLGDKKDREKLVKAYTEVQMKMEKIKKLKEAISELQMFGGKDSKQAIKELQKQLDTLEEKTIGKSLLKALDKGAEKIADKTKRMLKNAGEAVVDFVKNAFKDAIEELKTMSSYNYGTSLFQNEQSRQSALTYGLDSANAYALDKALSYMGVSSLEDTAYFNQNQQELFAKKIGQYVDKYNSLNNSGFFQKWDEFRVQFKDFKENMMYDIMQWIMDNKDTIYQGFNALTAIMQAILSMLSGISKAFFIERGQAGINAKTSDIISNYSTKNNSVTVNNTFNGVTTSNKPELVNAGNLTWSQVKEALNSY